MGCCDSCCEFIARNLVRFTAILIGMFGAALVVWGLILLGKVDEANAIIIGVVAVGAFVIITGIVGVYLTCRSGAAVKHGYFYMVLLVITILAQAGVAIAYAADPDLVTDAIHDACGQKSLPTSSTACTMADACSYPTGKNN